MWLCAKSASGRAGPCTLPVLGAANFFFFLICSLNLPYTLNAQFVIFLPSLLPYAPTLSQSPTRSVMTCPIWAVYKTLTSNCLRIWNELNAFENFSWPWLWTWAVFASTRWQIVLNLDEFIPARHCALSDHPGQAATHWVVFDGLCEELVHICSRIDSPEFRLRTTYSFVQLRWMYQALM